MDFVLSTLVSFAKICSDKKEEPTFKGNYAQVKEFFRKNQKEFEELRFNEIFDNLAISRITYFKTLETNSPYEIRKDFADFYNKIEDKKMFNKIGRKFYGELKYN